MFSFLGEYNYHFPEPVPLKKKLKDYLEENVEEKYYINNEKAQKLIKQLIENGTLPKNNHESRLALTEQSAIHIRETLQTASLQDMTAESQTNSKSETWLQKICIDTSMSGLENGAIRIYKSVAPSITAREYKEPRMILE